MRIGERRGGGFTYLGLLFLIAVVAAAGAVAAERWTTVLQRDREAELDFRGRQIARAIAAYQQTSPGADKAWPHQLDELVDDHRAEPPRHHLRRLYADPFTGQADWLLLRDPAGGVRGVSSRATMPALQTLGHKPGKEGDVVRLTDIVYMAPALASAAASSAEIAARPP